jgi:hypothetical protein
VKIFDIYKQKFSKIVSLLPRNFVLWLDTNESIEPWKTFENDYKKLDDFFQIIQKKFPKSDLIPLAYIHDPSGFVNDSWPVVTLFDLKDNFKIRVYDFGSSKNSPWDNFSYDSFDLWLDAVRVESHSYKEEMIELEEFYKDI